jgi:putative membrane protein
VASSGQAVSRTDAYPGFLLLGFLIIWAALAVDPHDRGAWLMENVLTVAALALLILTHRVFRLSRLSYTLIAAFLLMHSVGAHFTYSKVPLPGFLGLLPGFGDVERNNYDRLVHFSYGLLIAYPIREVFLRVVAVRGFWGYFLPLDLTLSSSLVYELLEWAVVVVFGGDLGVDFLGVQGDVWDAHKDMLLAGTGATLAMVATAAVNARLQSNFAQELLESFRVKRAEPLGEAALRKLRERALARRRRGGGEP